MSSSTSIDTEVLARLHRMARVAATRFHGLEEEDFLSEAWLAYQQSKDSGKSNSAALIRAEYAITDAVREWVGTPRECMMVDGEEVYYVMMAIPSPSRKTLRTKLPRQVKRLLDKLPERDRKIMYLTYMWNHTAKEIATDLQIPEATVSNVKHRVLRRMQSELGIASKKKKHYQLTSPDGQIHIVTSSIKAFCDLHGLDETSIRKMAKPDSTQKLHRGWSVLIITE